MHQCAQKLRALKTVLEAKPEEFVDDALIHDQAPQDIIKEFQLERVRLQAFVAAIDPGCEKELIRSSSLGLLKYNIESKLENG
ncbi:hypothetical protein TNCV_2096161 [Trichonephila clavipes]|nr:hypothetical protein TNCV_2096161 [Trichonephila clavipes]